jgi:hypothetical protein
MQQRPVNRPEKARRASLFSPTVNRRAFAAGEELTLQRPVATSLAKPQTPRAKAQGYAAKAGKPA